MELLYYLRVLRRRWILLAASVLLALTAAALVTTRTAPAYASSITLVVSAPDDGANAAAAYQGDPAVAGAREVVREADPEPERHRRAWRGALRDGLTAEEVQRRITAAGGTADRPAAGDRHGPVARRWPCRSATRSAPSSPAT